VPDISPTLNVAVFSGGKGRVYAANVTTAGPELDGPSTMTRYASTLADLSRLPADLIAHDSSRNDPPAGLVLIELRELATQRPHILRRTGIFAPAAPVLASPNTRQHWLWQTLQPPKPTDVHA
jgi:hypothetical protein